MSELPYDSYPAVRWERISPGFMNSERDSEELDSVVSEYLSGDSLGTANRSESKLASSGTELSEGSAHTTSPSTESETGYIQDIRFQSVAALFVGIVLIAVAGTYITTTTPDTPEVTEGVENSSTLTQTPTITPSPTPRSTPSTTPSPTASSIPPQSVPDACPTFSGAAGRLDPRLIMTGEYDWEINDTSSVFLDGDPYESVSITTYETPRDMFVFIEIYEYESAEIAQEPASTYENDENFQV